MSYRDDRDALLARAEALERDLAGAREELEKARAEGDELRGERDALREEVERLGGSEAPRESRRPASRSALPRTVVAYGAAVLAAVAGAGWFYFSARGAGAPSASDPSDGFAAVCPLRTDEALIVIDRIDTDPGRRSHFFYNIYAPATGERRVRAPLTSGDPRAPRCYGYEGDLVWVRTEEDGLHARRWETGALVHRQNDAVAHVPGEVHELYFDDNGGHVLVETKDGRRYQVPAADGFRPVELPATHELRRASGINRPQPGSLWARLDDDRQVRPEGNERRRLLIGNTPIGNRDWLRASLVPNPKTGTAQWSDPDSLLIVEPTAIGSHVFTVTRYGLDGTLHWTYDPEADAVHDAFGPYVAGAARGVLLYFTATAELIAIDVATGRERYRVHL